MIKYPLIAAFCLTAVSYGIAFFSVKQFYSEGLPYYDSIGAYWNAFSIMNITNSDGFVAGLDQASSYPLSWLQSFFALISSSILQKTPEQLISLNFLCILILLFALKNVAKVLKLSNLQSYLLYLIPFIPAAMFWWKGGYIDLRRDASFLTLLTASYFYLSAFLYSPTIQKGLIAGIILGLTQWSRGNALPQIIITIISVYFTYFLDKNIRGNWKVVIRKSTSILFSFITLCIPFYLYNTPAIILKYQENWSIGGNRLQSFIDFLQTGAVFIFGSYLKEFIISLLLILFILGNILYLFLRKQITFKKDISNQKSSFFIKAGVLLYFSLFVFNIIVVGIIKNLGDYQVYLPFFPLITAIFSVMVFGVSCIKFKKRYSTRIVKISFILITLGIIIGNAVRIEVNKPPVEKILHHQAEIVVNDIGHQLSGQSIAYLWLEDINVHTLNFYLTQSGFDPIRTSSRISENVDIENPPVTYISIREQQIEFEEGLRTKKIIVFAEDTSLYMDKDGFFSMFIFGKPVLDKLVSDPNYQKIYRFKIRDIHFVVLQGRS